MISQRQLQANRDNAQKCTGPKTPEGKAVSRRNALVHGIRAQNLLLDGEDPDLFSALQQRLVEELAPQDTIETELVDQIANLMWRVRRVPLFEAALLQWMGAWCQALAGLTDAINFDYLVDSDGARLHRRLDRPAKRKIDEARDQLTLGRLLQHSLDQDVVAKLNRYEAHLVRQLKQARAELRALQAGCKEKPSGAADGQSTLIEVLPPG